MGNLLPRRRNRRADTDHGSYSSIESIQHSNTGLNLYINSGYNSYSSIESSLIPTLPDRINEDYDERVGCQSMSRHADQEVSSENSNTKRETNIKSASRQNSQTGGLTNLSSGDWFYKIDIRCDQLYVDCIVDKRLEHKYELLKEHYQSKIKKSVTEFYKRFDIILQKMKDHMELYRTNALGNSSYPSPSEFEFLFYVKTKVSSSLSNTELFKSALIQNQTLLCRWLLTNLEQSEIVPAILLTPEDKDTFRPVAWYCTRLFYQTYKIWLKGAHNIWPGQLCCCTLKHYDINYCAKNGKKLLIVESEQKLEKLPKKYFGFEIYNHIQLGDNADSEFCAILQTQLSENEDSYYMHSNISGESAEILFKAHTNLTMVSGFPFKSKGFGSKHQIDRDNIIQLFCRKKGIVPIGENHFPNSIDEIKTDVLEGCPTLAVNLHVGDSIGPHHSKGTLGGFCEYMGKACFLTCAHVMYDVQNLLKSTYDYTRNEAVKAFLHTQTGMVECGSTIRRIFEHDINGATSVDAALVKIKLSACTVDPSDYVRDLRNKAYNFHRLGMASISLHENCLDHTIFATASNVPLVAPGAMSKLEQSADFRMQDDTDVYFNNIGQVAAHVSGAVFQPLIITSPAHLQITVGTIPGLRIFRMYKQMILNIPLQAGDSGTCIYIIGGPGRTGCVGMAIAFCAGLSIVTPLKEILSRL